MYVYGHFACLSVSVNIAWNGSVISLDFSPPDRPIIPVFLHRMLQQNSSRVTLSGVDKAGCGIKNMQAVSQKQYKRHAHSYCGTIIGSQIWFIKWCHCGHNGDLEWVLKVISATGIISQPIVLQKYYYNYKTSMNYRYYFCCYMLTEMLFTIKASHVSS